MNPEKHKKKYFVAILNDSFKRKQNMAIEHLHMQNLQRGTFTHRKRCRSYSRKAGGFHTIAIVQSLKSASSVEEYASSNDERLHNSENRAYN